jgi:hypothetical protein
MICHMKAVQEFVKEVDYMLYQKIVNILLPDVLRPIPSNYIINNRFNLLPRSLV